MPLYFIIMKPLLIAILLLSVLTCSAQKQNTYLLKYNGREVSTRDSAEYIRIITEPEPGEKYFAIAEYYTDGTPKSAGKISSYHPFIQQGQFTTYYPNGRRKNVCEYKDGKLVNEEYTFFPNGKIYTVTKHTAPTITTYEYAYDTSGVETVGKGEGYIKCYNAIFTVMNEEGPVKKGLKEGEWKGYSSPEKVHYTEVFKKGRLVSGTGTDTAGHISSYTVRMIPPKFVNSNTNLKLLNTHLIYPPDVKTDLKEDVVYVRATVEKDGSMSNFAIDKSISPAADAAAIEVIKRLPQWIPGYKFGKIERFDYALPVNFRLR
jgi:antitoxin component YwqK of YwqJK toxin-antitoxin module